MRIGGRVESSPNSVKDEQQMWIRFIVIIRDFGTGMSETSRDKLFVNFSKLNSDANVTGVGLGLSICKDVVE